MRNSCIPSSRRKDRRRQLPIAPNRKEIESGPVTASALVAGIGDPSAFAGARQFAAFLGLVPRQNSSGGKARLGRVSKMGNAYLRKLLVVGAHSVLYYRKRHTDPLRLWADKLMASKPFKLVAVAIANKLARIVFAIMSTGTTYQTANIA